MTYEPGETVNFRYTGYDIEAIVHSHDERRGWVTVEQTSDGYDDRELYPDGGPVFEAADEYVWRAGEEEPEAPFASMWRALTGELG